MRNLKITAVLVLLLIYCGLRILTWNAPVHFYGAKDLDWWLCVARDLSLLLTLPLILPELIRNARHNQSPPQNFLLGKLWWQNPKANLVMGAIAFVMLIAAIKIVIVPYLGRTERVSNSAALEP